MFVLKLLYSYFFLSTLYVLILSIAGCFRRKVDLHSVQSNKFNKIAVLVPAYKEDVVMISSVENILRSDYPKSSFDIIVIADSLAPNTLKLLRKFPVQVVEVSFSASTKVKSLSEAMRVIEDKYDIAIISDADNHLATNFLSKINNAFISGHTVVQGRRVAKNLDTATAIMDAYSEVVNNHIYRKGANNLGLSSALIGSGMAFRYSDLKETLKKVKAVGGFDKVLQLSLIEQGHEITYLEEAIIYDEKVSNTSSFKNQRKRWYSSQYKYLRKYSFLGLRMLLRGNFSYFNLAVLSGVFPSNIINLGSVFILALLFSFSAGSSKAILAWWILFFTLLISLIIPASNINFKKALLRALFVTPKLFLLSVKAILRIYNADQKFIHTQHIYQEASIDSK